MRYWLGPHFQGPGIAGLSYEPLVAVIGSGVRLKPRLQVKFPWRLKIGDNSWVGEGVWIDNLASVEIGANCCISQGAYICTGSHDWGSPAFDLVVRPVKIKDGAWIAAQSIIGPGVTVGEGAVLTLGSVASSDMKARWNIQRHPCAAN